MNSGYYTTLPLYSTAVQRPTAVTAYLNREQLLLFAFGWQHNAHCLAAAKCACSPFGINAQYTGNKWHAIHFVQLIITEKKVVKSYNTPWYLIQKQKHCSTTYFSSKQWLFFVLQSCVFLTRWHIIREGIPQSINLSTTILFNRNFHSLEVVSRWRDPQLQVSENFQIWETLG